MEMICPKCRGAMRSYERNGVTVDQCNECRGIFLDRGELERLMDAEATFNGAGGSVIPPPSPRAPVYGSPQYGSDRDRSDRDRSDRDRSDRDRYDSDRDRSDRDRYRSDDYYRKKRKRSFLEDLFD
jgi:uncharacterized protein